jgi:hypothetical protein
MMEGIDLHSAFPVVPHRAVAVEESRTLCYVANRRRVVGPGYVEKRISEYRGAYINYAADLSAAGGLCHENVAFVKVVMT